jgi:hypothetical protein
MQRIWRAALFAVGLCAGGLVLADAAATVVTNATPAVSATMQLLSSTGGCFTWQVTGKLKPGFRGFNADVRLVCATYSTIVSGGTPQVFPTTPASVDACGNFAFDATVCGASAQLDPSFVCNFVTHVDGTSAPQACNGKIPGPASVDDPNGSAPCSGGLCPDQP